MDETIGELKCRYRADLITMNLLRSAMDNAHKKVQSSEGPIQCLNETSKFYELAIIQIDVCLKLIIKEAEDQTETTRKKIITDLMELKDLFFRHLNDTKDLIIQKDKELMMERIENEISLESRDVKESVSLKKKLDILIRTVDHAFRQIPKAEDKSLEKQWRLVIEKETILIIIKGYINDLKAKSRPSIKFPVSKNKKSNTVDGVAKKDAIIARLIKERRESSLQTMAMSEHYMVLVNECCNEFSGYEIETKVKEDVFVYVLHEVAKDWTDYNENESIKTQLKDEIYKTVFLETMNDIRIILDFELQKIQNKISECCIQKTTRLEHVKQQVECIFGLAASIRKEELVYKKAFERRCHNLLLAETEVDLLGDQVEALQDLLRKIYYALAKYSSVLPHDFKETDILKLIETELGY